MVDNTILFLLPIIFNKYSFFFFEKGAGVFINSRCNMEATQNKTSNAKHNIKVTVIHSKLGKVEEIVQLMSHEARSAFKKTYGHILELLYTPVEAPMLYALTQFWKSSFYCFEFPKVDITAAIEEYTTMIRLPFQEKTGVYIYQGHYVGEAKVAKLIRV